MAKHNPNHRSALLLGGGGARAAYQVGVLKAVAEILPEQVQTPFPIICGTSAGSINAVALASNADNFHVAVERVVAIWSRFSLDQVFYADAKNLAKGIAGWVWSNLGFGKWRSGPASLLDNQPLRELLAENINFDNIQASIQSGSLHAYCLTACSYTSGESTTFFDGAPSIENWRRTHRDGRRSNLGIDHMMASSAIPVVFPSVKIRNEHFGDGSMRQISPISPAVHLGAEKILIIGLRMEGNIGTHKPSKHRPSLGQISGYVLDTLFLNSLYADVERMDRINRLIRENPGANSNLKAIDYMIVSPSKDIADIALKHYKTLPKAFRVALTFLGMGRGNSRRFISYLMFAENYCQELIALGYKDAMAQRQQLKTFLET